MLRLLTFGGCSVERDGMRLDTAAAHRKGLALLALLAAAGERGMSRDAVLALLWPESDDERARTSLRQIVHLLRNQLDAPDLLLPSPDLRLNGQVISSDVAELRAAVAGGNLADAAALYRGAFLDGFYLRNADELERWVAAERASLANAAAHAIETLAERAEQEGDARAATSWWRRLTELEPLSARAAVGLMRALDASGERAAALRHARVHELLVQNELGETSDGSVAAFADELRNRPAVTSEQQHATPPASDARPGRTDDDVGRDREVTGSGGVAATHSELAADGDVATTVTGGATSSSLTRRRSRSALLAVAALVVLLIASFAVTRLVRPDVAPSLVVLPLANTSGIPDNDVISDGLTENLIAALAAVPDVRVISRTSAFRFKERTLDLRAIADSLDVTTALDGSVQRSGEQLKISVQLVNAADGTVLWAETYDRRLSDFFAIQDEITRSIVSALRPRLAATSVSRPAAPAIRDMEAYELYLRGRHIFTTRTDRESIERVRTYFEAALARDPQLAQAHAGLSDVYARFAVFSYMPSRDAFTLAKAHAQHALAIDSTLAEAFTALGHASCIADYEWDAAERAFERANALYPNYTFGRLAYAVCLMMRGRLPDAERELLAARDFDPLSPAPSNLLGRLYVLMQQPDRAIASLQLALELSPQMDLALQQLGHAYLQKEMADEAIDAFQRAAAVSGARDSAHLAYAYAVTGNVEEARRTLERLTAAEEQRPELAPHLALAHTGLSELDRALDLLEYGFDEAAVMAGTMVEPGFLPLHEDPRWAALMRRMHID